MDVDRETVLLHFSRRGAAPSETECIAWPPAQVRLEDVGIDGNTLEIRVALADESLRFEGLFHIPLSHITRIDVVAGDCIVIQTHGVFLPRLVIRAKSRDDAFTLAEHIRAQAHL